MIDPRVGEYLGKHVVSELVVIILEYLLKRLENYEMWLEPKPQKKVLTNCWDLLMHGATQFSMQFSSEKAKWYVFLQVNGRFYICEVETKRLDELKAMLLTKFTGFHELDVELE